jgi:hypothetical protein
MNHTIFVAGLFCLVTACHNDPKPVEPTTTTQPAPQETVVTDPATFTEERPAQPQPEVEKTVEKKKTTTHKAAETSKPASTTNNSTAANNTTESTTSTSANEGKQKKGWSKTAKGAVIGGVTGAAAGAIINKNNRAAGAVIGGVVGAGAGAIIGNEMDKKDGRH